MKSGASDPFDDEEPDDAETEASTNKPADAQRERSPAMDSEGEPEGTDTRQLSREQLPLVLRRDRVKDERPEVHQLFVQKRTHERAVDAERELESRLGVDLSRTDAREAIYLAGMSHLDEAAAVLREWGYDL